MKILAKHVDYSAIKNRINYKGKVYDIYIVDDPGNVRWYHSSKHLTLIGIRVFEVAERRDIHPDRFTKL